MIRSSVTGYCNNCNSIIIKEQQERIKQIEEAKQQHKDMEECGRHEGTIQQDNTEKKQQHSIIENQPPKSTMQLAENQSLSEDERHYQKGLAYYKEKKYDMAFKRFNKSAALGNTDAFGMLGECYFYGQGVEVDHCKAFEYYLKAAENGNITAQANAGYCYSNGLGVPQDYEKAVHWYQRAAEQGNSTAQYDLGVRYYQGQGVKKDVRKAIMWFENAIQNGNDNAYFMLGYINYQDEEVKRNYMLALSYFEKCAKTTDNRQAQYYVGEMYMYGKGTQIDYSKAKEYLCLSAFHGYKDALILLQDNMLTFFNKEQTITYYNWIMENMGRDPKESISLQLHQLSLSLHKSGVPYFEQIGIIASQLYEVAKEIYSPDFISGIDFFSLATHWIKENQ